MPIEEEFQRVPAAEAFQKRAETFDRILDQHYGDAPDRR
jgi:hypothetical protein